MRNLKTLLFLALTTMGVFLAAIVYQPGSNTVQSTNIGPLLPGLAEQIGTAQTITILHDGDAVTLRRDNKNWVVAEKANYPAMEDQVRALLLGLAQAQRVEPKTRNPENYATLGLANPDKSGTDASKIDIKNTKGQTIARLILGKRRSPTENIAERSDFYALLEDDPQTWLATGQIPTIGTPGSWLKRTLLELERARITEVILTHSDGESMRLVPKVAGQTNLTLEGLKPDEVLQNDFIVDDIADRFILLQLEDVRPANQLKWPEKADLIVETKTKDGLVILLNVAKIDGQHWIRLNAEARPNAVPVPPTQSKTSQPQVPDSSKTIKAPSQESVVLNTRWQGWAYTLADWAYQALNKRRADLVKVADVSPATTPPQNGPQPEHTTPGVNLEPSIVPEVDDEATVEPTPDDVLDTMAPQSHDVNSQPPLP